VQKILLRDDVIRGEGGLAKTRDPRIWFVPKAEGERRVALESVAVGGEEVREAASARAWGLEVPWRVKVIKVSGKPSRPVVGEAEERVMLGVEIGDTTAKRKPGKKRRILLREKKKKLDELAEQKRIEKEKKEESEKEKRTRKNRERKLKRRLKARTLKTEGSADATRPLDMEDENSQSDVTN
jgi:hypothetical protein